MTRFIPFLWLALALLLGFSAALALRYEAIPDDPGINLSTKIVHHVVWDRWKRRLCVAFLGREELACTADELKSATSPSIDEARAHLAVQNGGYIEKITRTGQNLVVEGWAVDIAAKSPAVAVRVFVAGHETAVGIPNLPRPDVATRLNITSSDAFGFRIIVPVGSASGGDVHVFAQLHDGLFAELEHVPAK